MEPSALQSTEQKPKGRKGSLTNPEVVYENVPGHVIPIIEREFDDFDTRAASFLSGQETEEQFIGFRLKRLARLRPRQQPTLDVVGLPPRCPERRGRQVRAVAGAAVEDHRPLLGELRALPGEQVESDVGRARDVSRLVLVVAAHVHGLGAVRDQLDGGPRIHSGALLGGLDLGHRAGGYSERMLRP